MSYRYIDHTADIGIHIVSRDERCLFEEAAQALIDMMGAWCGEGSRSERISVEGIDMADVLVRWLQELLYRIEVENLRIAHVKVEEVGPKGLTAHVTGVHTPSRLHGEIKAVTYHNLEILDVDNHVETTIIFDT